jgi:hypothetical protein
MARPNPLDLTVCPTEESGGVSVEDCAKTEICVLVVGSVQPGRKVLR